VWEAHICESGRGPGEQRRNFVPSAFVANVILFNCTLAPFLSSIFLGE
jgi:hypothetical protein